MRLIKISNKKIKLYHGTSSVFINDILSGGLLPTGYTGNTMFQYTDYNRKGQPKHPDCVYLTNTLENAQRYGANGVRREGGFPVIIEVQVNEDNLTWDDDALYKNYQDFDFGVKNIKTINWKREPKKELWEQSLEINQQCSHHGKIPSSQITKFYVNQEWITVEQFKNMLSFLKNINLKVETINENKNLNIIDYIFQTNYFNFNVTFINRKFYLYNFQMNQEINFNQLQKHAISIKIMQQLKELLPEFGAQIIYTPDFPKIGLKPKQSIFFYTFGLAQPMSEENTIKDIKETVKYSQIHNQIFNKIINQSATQKEFDFVYKYSIDFIGDLIQFCKLQLNLNNQQIINIMQTIKNTYKDAYHELVAHINYMIFKLNSNQF